MIPVDELNQKRDPIDKLIDAIEHVWVSICDEYDVVSIPPVLHTLFDHVDFNDPCQVAEMVIANMLTEVIECVGRFSPWYKLPASEFGLIPQRDDSDGLVHWVLCPEAMSKWGGNIELLAAAIFECGDRVHLMIAVDDLMERVSTEKLLVLACCDCKPPIVIRIKRAMLCEGVIVCDACGSPFHFERGEP